MPAAINADYLIAKSRELDCKRSSEIAETNDHYFHNICF